jgi:hypothetical protein
MVFKYDVAFSFAGENRKYVEEAATILRNAGVEIFYDRFEEADLWGKDLAVHFDFVYRKSAKYCVPFISNFYKEKVWTRHEIRSAISRAIETNAEYILPARFDDTEIEGLRPTIGFIDLRNYKPEEFAKLILKKLNKEPKGPISRQFQTEKVKVEFSIGVVTDGRGYRGIGFSLQVMNTDKEHCYILEPYFEISEPYEGNNTFYLIDRKYLGTYPFKLEFGERKNLVFEFDKRIAVKFEENLSPSSTISAIVNTTIGEKYTSNPVSIETLKNSLFNKS